MDDCIFCKIIKGDIPSYKVYEDEFSLAFLTIAPIKAGHTLIIPKKHQEYLFEMDSLDLGNLMDASKKVAQILQKAFKPKTSKIGLMVAGLEVAHVHLHLIPMDSEKDLNFSLARPAEQSDLKKAVKAIDLS